MNVDGDVGASAVSPAHLEWKFSQVFGERAAGEEVQEGHTSILRGMVAQTDNPNPYWLRCLNGQGRQNTFLEFWKDWRLPMGCWLESSQVLNCTMTNGDCPSEKTLVQNCSAIRTCPFHIVSKVVR